MFLRNYYVAIGTLLRNQNNHTVKLRSGADGSITSNGYISGYLTKFMSSGTNGTMDKPVKNYNTISGVVFGNGTTPPTFEDYCLSGDTLANFTASAKVTTSEDANGVTATALYTLVNTGEEELTVGEVALVANTVTSSSSPAYTILYERTVLESPITIPAGGVGQVTYTIRMNYPTA